MKLVILGGVAAGAKAAAKAGRLLPDAQIDIYTDDTHVSYSACGLPYYIEGNFENYEILLVRSPEEFKAQGINVHLQHRAIKILPESKQILIFNIVEEKGFLIEYDKLIIAIGASPVIQQINNINLKNIFTLRKIEDGIAVKEKVLRSKNAVIVGGGYIGVELLEAFVQQGLRTTLIEYAPHIMPMFDDDISKIIKNQLTEHSNSQYEILTSEIISEFSGDMDGVRSVRTTSGLDIQTDLVMLCTGAKPNVEIAMDAGIAIGETGAIKVNEKMETNIPDIYACGDCAEETLVINNTKIWMPLGSIANKEGRCAAMNACGFEDIFPGVLASAVTRCLDLTMSLTGLTEKNARKHGFKPVSATVTKNDKVGYMPDVNNITLKLVADSESGLLLGAQAVGTGDADKRINVFASALLGKLTVEEFLAHDLTYAPPFSPTIDPLLNAAQILASKIKKTL
ncbi:MAG: FAD-dependent oxidoreductase [Heliobacteriaceae bacterium]|jgi:NADPH-dependent 2,4-dienoyl-CoA reductase/sulfur reductase-like enzyme|nr:FAD-dependent oxidoreductase [Heliobacteriaceae bacterium]